VKEIPTIDLTGSMSIDDDGVLDLLKTCLSDQSCTFLSQRFFSRVLGTMQSTKNDLKEGLPTSDLPPECQPQPPAEETAPLVSWIMRLEQRSILPQSAGLVAVRKAQARNQRFHLAVLLGLWAMLARFVAGAATRDQEDVRPKAACPQR
jgi:hypothetical protein